MHSTLTSLSSPPGLLIASDFSLVREGLCALASGDLRFSKSYPWEGKLPAEKLVEQLPPTYTAIVDARFPIGPLQQLCLSKPPAAMVVLAAASSVRFHKAKLNDLEPLLHGLPVEVLDWQRQWKEVAERLLIVPPGQMTTHRQDGTHASAIPSQQPLIVQNKRLYSAVPAACPLKEAAVLTTLSRREVEVLQLVGEGHSVRECAKELHLAVSTVDNHKSRLMKKTGARKSTDLVRFAIRSRLIDA